VAWHAAYDDGSPLTGRLAVVQRRIHAWLDRAPAGPLRVISICAGQGRDLLPVLGEHPRGIDVRARLVELDPVNAGAARRAAATLVHVEVVEADAGSTDAYVGAVPADLVLACGVFGNVTDDDVERTIRALPALGGPGTTVIWTRHRRPPDLTPTVRAWFSAAGFAEVWWDAPPDAEWSVGVHRLAGEPARFVAGQRLFTFLP
jgi:hypothetical protein